MAYLSARGTVRAFWTAVYLKTTARQVKGRGAMMPVPAQERRAAAMVDRAGRCAEAALLQRDTLKRLYR
jgi:hypothetical protein